MLSRPVGRLVIMKWPSLSLEALLSAFSALPDASTATPGFFRSALANLTYLLHPVS